MAQALSNLAAGSLLKLPEMVSGVTTLVPFLVCAHGNYAAGRTMLCRNAIQSNQSIRSAYDPEAEYGYVNSPLDTWLNSTYLAYIDASVRDLISNVSVKVVSVPAQGLVTLSRKAFLLSYHDVFSTYDPYIEAAYVSYFNSGTRRRAYNDAGTASAYWLRTPTYNNDPWTFSGVYSLTTVGAIYSHGGTSSLYGVRPVITLPYTMEISDNTDADGCYNLPGVGAGPVWHVKKSGVWTPEPLQVKQSGVWVPAEGLKTKRDGVWADSI